MSTLENGHIHNYYVYSHTCDAGCIKYIGKGIHGRAWDSHSRSSNHRKWMEDQLPFLNVNIFESDMTEDQAFQLEKELVKQHNPMYNKILAKQVYDHETKTLYNSIEEASTNAGVSYNSVVKAAHRRKKGGNNRFEYK